MIRKIMYITITVKMVKTIRFCLALGFFVYTKNHTMSKFKLDLTFYFFMLFICDRANRLT